MAVLSRYRNQLLCTTSRETKVVFILERVFFFFFFQDVANIYENVPKEGCKIMDKLCCLKGYQNKVQRLRQTSLFRTIKDRLVTFSQIIAGNTLIFLNYLEQKKTSPMTSSPECITWMVVGLTESVAIITLNSLTVIAFCRDRNLRKRSTYLVINLAVADMISGGTSTLDLFYDVGAICNFWRYNILSWYQILQVLYHWFPIVSLTNMTVISLDRLNATFWPFRHRTIKKSVYWVLIIAIWLTALLFSCALIMIQYYTRKLDYYFYAWSSFIFFSLLVICVSNVFIFVKLRFGSQPRHHGAANRERKLTVTLFTATSLSLVLWLPYVITRSLFFATDIFSSLSEIALFRLLGGSIVLLYANSLLNPILYSMRIPDFRRALKILCRQRPQQHRQVQNFPLREINPQN